MRTLTKRRVIALSLTVLMIFVTAPASAARCKYNVDTVNHRTGEKVRWTKWNTFRLRQDPVMHVAISEGDRKYLGLRLMLNRGSRTKRPSIKELDNELVIAEDAKLLLLMADESILELHAAQGMFADSDVSASGANNYAIYSEIIVKYELDAETMAALTSQRLKVLRITADDAEYTYEFGKKGSDRIQKNLACIQ